MTHEESATIQSHIIDNSDAILAEHYEGTAYPGDYIGSVYRNGDMMECIIYNDDDTLEAAFDLDPADLKLSS